jgi:hypothetical protein
MPDRPIPDDSHGPDDLRWLDHRHGPSSFEIPHRSAEHGDGPDGGPGGVTSWTQGATDEQGNKYQRRLEDIDPARLEPSAMVEHHEQLRPRPSPFTVEGYIQGFRDLSDAAITGRGERRYRARMLVFMSLAALLTLPALQLLGILHLI